ncbi:hypothetical protein ABW21_db0202987 [Orbilia brochopaga]|nr:hypothetical protein ABW21_db0202987 [Drechslerella brochopaga]
MAAIASKNLFDLLGNDIEDENDTPKPPTKEVIKKTTTSKKNDPPLTTVTPSYDSGRGGAKPRRGDGNEAAFRDRGIGRENNRSRPTEETGGLRERGAGRGRGPRGGRGRQYDRHSATDRVDTDKQVSQGWGSNKGNSEWNDEKAGETIAQAEATDDTTAPAAAEGEGQTEAADAEPIPEPEEDKTKSFAQYLQEKETRAPVEELPEARRANEGARENKKPGIPDLFQYVSFDSKSPVLLLVPGLR